MTPVWSLEKTRGRETTPSFGGVMNKGRFTLIIERTHSCTIWTHTRLIDHKQSVPLYIGLCQILTKSLFPPPKSLEYLGKILRELEMLCKHVNFVFVNVGCNQILSCLHLHVICIIINFKLTFKWIRVFQREKTLEYSLVYSILEADLRMHFHYGS